MTPHELRGASGLRLAVHELGGEGPPALYVHGTSFHGRVFAPLARAVGAHRAFGLDLRGHGASERPPGDAVQWSDLADDVGVALSMIEDRCGLPIFGIGHSAGATALLLADARRPGALAALYCYEPICLTDAIRAELPLPGPLAGAAKRRAHFESTDEAFAYFRTRPPLSELDGEVLREYVDHGLVSSEGGGVDLACAPTFEAAMYAAGYGEDALDRVSAARAPVTVAYGGKSEGVGLACAPVVAASLERAGLVRVEGLGHLGPLEDPPRVGASMIPVFGTPSA